MKYESIIGGSGSFAPGGRGSSTIIYRLSPSGGTLSSERRKQNENDRATIAA